MKFRMALLVVAALAVPGVGFGQLQVITSGGFAASLRELLPEFETATGIKVEVGRGPSQGKGQTTIGRSSGGAFLPTW